MRKTADKYFKRKSSKENYFPHRYVVETRENNQRNSIPYRVDVFNKVFNVTHRQPPLSTADYSVSVYNK